MASTTSTSPSSTPTATAKIADNFVLEAGASSRGARTPSVAASGNNAIVAYYDADSSFPEDIRLKMFGPTGTLLDTETVAATDRQLVDPDTATLKDGRVIIVWQENSGLPGDSSNVQGRIYDPATKSFSTGVFNIDAGAGSQDDPSVAALADGGFVVTWTDSSLTFGDNSDLAVHGRRFDATGAAAGDEFLVNTRIAGSQERSGVAVNSNGRVFAAWTSADSADGNGKCIQGRLFDAKVEVVNGTANTDIITTYTTISPRSSTASPATTPSTPAAAMTLSLPAMAMTSSPAVRAPTPTCSTSSRRRIATWITSPTSSRASTSSASTRASSRS